MNYIKEMNAFYDWLETRPLSTSAIVLWHALMHINNKTGWTDNFAVAVSVLCVKTGLSERSVFNARNELETKGYIRYQSRKGSKSAIYQLIRLSAIDADNHADNNAHNFADNDLSAINADNVSVSVSDNISDNVSALNKLVSKKEGRIDTRARVTLSLPGEWETLRQDFEQTFRLSMKASHYEMVNSYLEEGMQIELILLALEDARNNEASYPRYLWRILDSWSVKGIKTISDYRRHIQENLNTSGGNDKPPESKPGAKKFQRTQGLSKSKTEILEKFKKAGLK